MLKEDKSTPLSANSVLRVRKIKIINLNNLQRPIKNSQIQKLFPTLTLNAEIVGIYIYIQYIFFSYFFLRLGRLILLECFYTLAFNLVYNISALLFIAYHCRSL